MEYSSLITLTKNGFNIPEKLLYPVGIYDASRCWGAVFHNVGHDIREINGDRQLCSSDCQILLSPIPFRSWACTIRVQARVNDEPGKLKHLARALSPCASASGGNVNTNIITISEALSGFYHGRVNILAELFDMRDKAAATKKDISKLENITSKLNVTSEYSLEIFNNILKIDKLIQDEDKENKFLYRAGTGNSNHLWLEEEITRLIGDDKRLLDFLNSSKIKPFSIEWIHTLAICYLHCRSDHPFRFDYSLSGSTLVSSGPNDSIEEIKSHFNIDLPCTFLATFNPLSKYIRMVSLHKETNEKKLVKINYKYKCNTDHDKFDIAKNGSNGLLHFVTERLSNNIGINKIKVNTKHVTSYTKRYSQKREEGGIEIIGIMENVSDFNYDIKKINDEVSRILDGFPKKNNSKFTTEISAGMSTPYKIFLSCREEFKKIKSFESICKKIEQEYGVRFIMSDRNANLVTSDVVRKISNSDGLIIIFSLTEDEKNKYKRRHTNNNELRPNLGWLLFEYGLSMGMKIPIAPIQDVTIVLEQDWDTWINVSKDASHTLLSDASDSGITEVLEQSVKTILDKIANKDN